MSTNFLYVELIFMKNSKTSIFLLFFSFAIPIPLSLASWIGTVMSLAGGGRVVGTAPYALLLGIIAGAAMVMAGTYVVSYIIAIAATIKNKRISIISLLPALHIIVTVILILGWSGIERVVAMSGK